MQYFTKDTLAFLMENRFHNSREWYKEHKDQYTDIVLEPFQNLVVALSPTLLAIDDKLITDPRVDRTISRIYRDTRFSKDKTLYREVMWCSFCRDKREYDAPPGFFFEMTPDWFHYGCGYFSASGREMDAMRELILEDHASFRAAKKAFDTQSVFTMEGDSYKRSKCPDAPVELQTWLNRKGISFNCKSTDFDLLFSDRLADRIAGDYPLLAPIYNFFLAAQSRKLHI